MGRQPIGVANWHCFESRVRLEIVYGRAVRSWWIIFHDLPSPPFGWAQQLRGPVAPCRIGSNLAAVSQWARRAPASGEAEIAQTILTISYRGGRGGVGSGRVGVQCGRGTNRVADKAPRRRGAGLYLSFTPAGAADGAALAREM